MDMTSASNLHQLNLALARGAEKETFVFPKGPSGKVKLAPRRPKAPVDAKEVLLYCPFPFLGSVIQSTSERPAAFQKGQDGGYQGCPSKESSSR